MKLPIKFCCWFEPLLTGELKCMEELLTRLLRDDPFASLIQSLMPFRRIVPVNNIRRQNAALHQIFAEGVVAMLAKAWIPLNCQARQSLATSATTPSANDYTLHYRLFCSAHTRQVTSFSSRVIAVTPSA